MRPTIKELYSLMNFSGTDPMGNSTSGATPFIATDTFEFGYGDTAAEAYVWTADLPSGAVPIPEGDFVAWLAATGNTPYTGE